MAAELRERPVGTQDRATAVGIATREAHPRLIIDAARRKVCLRLPEQILPEGAEEIHWRVNLDGTTKIYRTGRPWGETGPFAESLDVAIERQVRELTVTDSTTGTTWVIPVVDSEDPAGVQRQRPKPHGQGVLALRRAAGALPLGCDAGGRSGWCGYSRH